ncbi:MAG: DUF898 domain-containing protein [Alphaproteobacteria bacterium]|nr:DUF898 domain-containing protein [Alphaproteobacteria bacterium]
MPDGAADNATTAEPTRYGFEFRGTGSEYFRIWIVNLALTILTLGVFSAWAKVRTLRYFRGNTFIAGHAFDYHASPLRILIGRIIAVSLFFGYEISAAVEPIYASAWLLVIGVALPWLVNASLRFNARYTSYRNVRFYFHGRYFEALVAYVLWPIGGFATLGLLMPAARRARDFFYTNNHTFGGRPFHTQFSAGAIYLIYFIGVMTTFVTLGLAFGGAWYGGSRVLKYLHLTVNKSLITGLVIGFYAFVYLVIVSIAPAIHTLIVNLSVNHTTLDGKHRMRSRMWAPAVAWITVTNALLTLLTLGFYYPWAKVRLARYEASKLSLLMDGDIDAYASDVSGTQSAVGEEIGSFFSFDFGL